MQIGNIGPGDQEDESGDDHAQAEAGRVISLQVPDTSAAGREHEVDFRAAPSLPRRKKSRFGRTAAYSGKAQAYNTPCTPSTTYCLPSNS